MHHESVDISHFRYGEQFSFYGTAMITWNTTRVKEIFSWSLQRQTREPQIKRPLSEPPASYPCVCSREVSLACEIFMWSASSENRLGGSGVRSDSDEDDDEVCGLASIKSYQKQDVDGPAWGVFVWPCGVLSPQVYPVTDFIAGIYGEIFPTTGLKTGSESWASGAFILSNVWEKFPNNL